MRVAADGSRMITFLNSFPTFHVANPGEGLGFASPFWWFNPFRIVRRGIASPNRLSYFVRKRNDLGSFPTFHLLYPVCESTHSADRILFPQRATDVILLQRTGLAMAERVWRLPRNRCWPIRLPPNRLPLVPVTGLIPSIPNGDDLPEGMSMDLMRDCRRFERSHLCYFAVRESMRSRFQYRRRTTRDLGNTISLKRFDSIHSQVKATAHGLYWSKEPYGAVPLLYGKTSIEPAATGHASTKPTCPVASSMN